MPAPDHLNHLLKQIGPQMDLDEVVAYDEENFWLLQGGDEVLLEITWAEDRQMVVFSALLGSVREENITTVYPLLLNYNYTWEATGGARMAADPSDGEVVLLLDQPVAELDLPMLQRILGNLIETVPIWRAVLQSPADHTSSLSLDPSIMPTGSIRV